MTMVLYGLVADFLNSNLQIDVKHPILLPKSRKFTKKIFLYFHLRNYHVGLQTLLYAIRQEYWHLGDVIKK